MAIQRWSGDPVSEQKLALERLVERRVASLDGQAAISLEAQAGDPNSSAAVDGFEQAVFTTGYSGGETVLGFTWDISEWESEIVSGSDTLWDSFRWDLDSWPNTIVIGDVWTE